MGATANDSTIGVGVFLLVLLFCCCICGFFFLAYRCVFLAFGVFLVCFLVFFVTRVGGGGLLRVLFCFVCGWLLSILKERHFKVLYSHT